jgi:hypothetical protein
MRDSVTAQGSSEKQQGAPDFSAKLQGALLIAK